METNQDNKITERVLQKIENSEIKQHSKIYFRFRVFLLILAIIAILVISIFLCSFIIFNVKFSGQFALIGFGKHGTILSLKLFPWILFILDAVLIILAGLLFRSFRFGYKTPVVYLGFGVIIAMTLGGIVISQDTSIHSILWQSAQNKSLPIIGGIYRHVCSSSSEKEEIYRGKITNIEGNFLIVDIKEEECGPIVSHTVAMPDPDAMSGKFKIGDNIFIEGKRSGKQIEAQIIDFAPPIPDILK